MPIRFQQSTAWAALWLSCWQLAPSAPGQTASEAPLNIVVVDGQGAINNIRSRTRRDSTVQVEADGKPVTGASVVFTAPSQGPSGAFSSGEKTLVVTTDTEGRAIARGFRPNTVAGKVEIRVNASHQGKTASTVITQFNMAVQDGKPPAGSSGKWLAIFIGAGAAGAAGIIVGTRKSSTPSSPAPPPAPAAISISPGSGSVGPPQ